MQLKSGITITLIANLVFAISQWVIIAGLNKSGNVEVVGQYAYAIAMAGLFLTAGQFGLRQFLLSNRVSEKDMERIFYVRILTSTLAWLALFAYAYLLIDERYRNVVLLLGIAKLFENLSDVCHGYYQREMRLGAIARSRIARAILSPLVFLGTYFYTNNLQYAAVSLGLSWLVVFLLFDLAAISPKQRQFRNIFPISQLIRIGKTALPMGIATLLVMLTVNIPLLVLTERYSDLEVGQYASIFYFVTAGSLVTQSAMQVVSPAAVKLIGESNISGLKRLMRLSYLMVALLGATAIVFALLIGDWVLVLFYGEGFDNLGYLLVIAAITNFALGFQSVGGVMLTAYGTFNFQMVMCAISVVISYITSIVLVSSRGIEGALLAGAATAFVVSLCFFIKITREMQTSE